jgi:hypothetical protein
MPDQPEERWLTYREAGELLGISANAVRVRAQRARWPRRVPNMPGAPTLVRVPEEALVRPGAPLVRGSDGERAGHEIAEPDGHERAHNEAHVRALAQAIEALREQLAIANQRNDELTEEHRCDAKERRQLLTALADARAAERISADSAAALRHELDLLRARPWWRRWLR